MLTAKQAKFVAFYQVSQNSTESAKNAGYPDKSAPSIGCQLLKNPKIIAELDAWRAKKQSQITKEDFVDLAISDYKGLKIEEPNKPRFLDIAGKALGYIGANDRPNQTINITQNKLEINSLPSGAKWQQLRNILESD